jgi:hypothetical protein
VHYEWQLYEYDVQLIHTILVHQQRGNKKKMGRAFHFRWPQQEEEISSYPND